MGRVSSSPTASSSAGTPTSIRGDAIEPPRHIGVLDASSIFVGIVLGSGIFVAPALVAGAAPGGWGAAALWAIGGVAAAAGAFCYAECASRVPREGGFFAFYREAYGEAPAFVAAWAGIFVTYPVSIAAIALIGGGYLAELAGLEGRPRGIAIAAILAAAAINVAGLRTGPRAQRLLTLLKAGALLLLCVAAALAPRVPEEAPVAADGPGAPVGLLAAMAVVLFTYDGWSDVTLVAGEIRDPRRDLGRAVVLGIGTLVVLYAVVQASVLALLPVERAAASDRVVAAAVEAGLGDGWGRAVSTVVVLSTFGSVAAIVLVVARLVFAMARRGALPGFLGSLDPRFGTPARATAAVAAISSVYVLVAGFRDLVAYFTFAVWIFYGLTAVAVFRLRRMRVGEETAWRAPGGALAPAVVLTVGAAMTGGLFLQDPVRSLVGLAVLASGFLVLAFRRGK